MTAAQASSIVPVPFDKLIDKAGTIVKVRVLKTESFVTLGDDSAVPNYVEQGAIAIAQTPRATEIITTAGQPASAALGRRGGAVMTRATLAVLDNLKGSPSSTLQLLIAGGTVDGTTVAISGLPQLETGATYLLFVRPDYTNTGAPMVGAWQGVFRYVIDARSGGEVLLDGEGLTVTGVRNGVVEVDLEARDKAGNAASTSAAALPITELGSVRPAISDSARETHAATPMSASAFADLVRSKVTSSR